MLKEIPLKYQELDNGETLAYRKVGNKEQTVLLIHGNMSSSLHYDLIMEELEDYYTIYAIDLRGFGHSTYNRPINSLHDFSIDVHLFIEKLGLTNLNVLGWSTGGGVALELAADIPNKISKVILMDSVGVKGYPMFKKDASGQPILTEQVSTRDQIAEDPVQVKPVLKAFETKNKEFFRTVWNMTIYNLNQPSNERYERYLDEIVLQRNLLDVDYALVQFNMSNDHNGICEGSDRLKLIQAPVLIIHGDKDLVIPVNYARETQQYLGDQAQLKILGNSGHSPITDQFQEVIDTIIDFTKN